MRRSLRKPHTVLTAPPHRLRSPGVWLLTNNSHRINALHHNRLGCKWNSDRSFSTLRSSVSWVPSSSFDARGPWPRQPPVHTSPPARPAAGSRSSSKNGFRSMLQGASRPYKGMLLALARLFALLLQSTCECKLTLKLPTGMGVMGSV